MATVTDTPRGGGGGERPKRKNGCVPQVDLEFRAPLIKFIFPEEQFSDVGGWVGRAEEPRLPFPPPPPPPLVTSSRDAVGSRPHGHGMGLWWSCPSSEVVPQ